MELYLMAEFNPAELKYYALIFGVILLIVYAYRRAIKKVQSKHQDQLKEKVPYIPATPSEKPGLTEEQFNRSWKALSYMLLLAGAGNLYMAYTALRSAIQTGGLWVWWVDAAFSILAAFFAYLTWRKRSKNWVFAYFIATMIPLFIFMSIQGPPFKISAMIHLFPLVLLYFVLKPVWNDMQVQ
jgi:hypothetical protein